MKFLNKLFSSNEYFTIALRPKKNYTERRGWFFPLRAEKKRWFADPMIAEYKGKAYLFYEATDEMHGHIEVAEIQDDCVLGTIKTIFSDEFHYSYPFVFCFENEWYMIPETSDRSEVCLYRAMNFPYEWKKTSVLLRCKAVDTTVFEYERKHILLTYIINGANEKVIPRAYELDIKNHKIVKELDWKKYNGLRVRGAGPVFTLRERLFRPAQINREDRYGDGIAIYEIKQCGSKYSEELHTEMDMVTSKIRGKVATGMHTYTVSEHYEAIDIRVRDIDLLKPIKRILKSIRRENS